jgi:hypothetical protein
MRFLFRSKFSAPQKGQSLKHTYNSSSVPVLSLYPLPDHLFDAYTTGEELSHIRTFHLSCLNENRQGDKVDRCLSQSIEYFFRSKTLGTNSFGINLSLKKDLLAFSVTRPEPVGVVWVETGSDPLPRNQFVPLLMKGLEGSVSVFRRIPNCPGLCQTTLWGTCTGGGSRLVIGSCPAISLVLVRIGLAIARGPASTGGLIRSGLRLVHRHVVALTLDRALAVTRGIPLSLDGAHF